MNHSNLVFFDFETGSRYPETTQPTQLAAIAINGRTLEIIPDSIFNSYIRPVFDIEECSKLGIAPLEQDALSKTNIKLSNLENAPVPKVVWKNFTAYCKQYSKGTGSWDKPIRTGFNIKNFDDVIIHRLCCYRPYKFGPLNKEGRPNLFHPLHSIDLMELMWMWTENLVDVTSNSMDFYRKWMNIPEEGAHNAVVDVVQGAELLIRMLELHRKCVKKVSFAGAFQGHVRNSSLYEHIIAEQRDSTSS